MFSARLRAHDTVTNVLEWIEIVLFFGLFTWALWKWWRDNAGP